MEKVYIVPTPHILSQLPFSPSVVVMAYMCSCLLLLVCPSGHLRMQPRRTSSSLYLPGEETYYDTLIINIIVIIIIILFTSLFFSF